MEKTICWWSGGITSAVAVHLSLKRYPSCEIVFIDTKNESEDTYRFKKDCEAWYGQEILTLSAIGAKYGSIQEVWERYNSLNVASGAICSAELKRDVRLRYEKGNSFARQVFGFEFKASEMKRALGLAKNYPKSKPVFPLIGEAMSKEDCLSYAISHGIEPPSSYKLGFENNNCLQTGCVQGGIGYWQKMKADFPDKFNTMAELEHKLTGRKGGPVTMLKDQSKAAKESGLFQVFLLPHPDYPEHKDISMMTGRPPKKLGECNGFCGTNDLIKDPAENEINYAD